MTPSPDSRPRHPRRLLLRGALGCAACWALPAAPAQAPGHAPPLPPVPSAPQPTPPTDAEAGVKASFLWKFLGYVDWPASAFAGAQAPLEIAVMDDDAVFTALEAAVAGRRMNGRGVLVRRLTFGDPLDGVHLLYLGGAWPHGLQDALGARPVLVVTSLPGGLPPGSALNFVVVRQRVRFEASPATAERAGIKISARLLSVAERVVAP